MLLICSHADEVEDAALLEQRCARMVECVETELRKQSAAQWAELARLRVSEVVAPRAEVAQRLKRLKQSLAQPLRLRLAGGRALAVSSKTSHGVVELRALLLDTAFDKEAFPRFGEFMLHQTARQFLYACYMLIGCWVQVMSSPARTA
jgi:hypothetical protein